MRTALILFGIAAVSVGGYLIYTKVINAEKSTKEAKENRKLIFEIN
jgi:hypothetical protein